MAYLLPSLPVYSTSDIGSVETHKSGVRLKPCERFEACAEE